MDQEDAPLEQLPGAGTRRLLGTPSEDEQADVAALGSLADDIVPDDLPGSPTHAAGLHTTSR